MSDLTWVVRGSWPVTRRADDLTTEEILAVLDEFDDYWDLPEKRSDGS